jgi:hypothetical protein
MHSFAFDSVLIDAEIDRHPQIAAILARVRRGENTYWWESDALTDNERQKIRADLEALRQKEYEEEQAIKLEQEMRKFGLGRYK